MTPVSAGTAVLDACVLYGATVADLLMRLAAAGLFRARWTERIHAEWIDALLRSRPDLDRAALERRRAAMNRGAEGCVVEGYERWMAGLSLPDPGDHHVLAAAIQARAHVIATYDLDDFPAVALEPFGLEAWHPDEFVSRMIDLAPARVRASVRDQRLALRNPPRTVDEFLDSLRRAALPETAAKLAQWRDLL